MRQIMIDGEWKQMEAEDNPNWIHPEFPTETVLVRFYRRWVKDPEAHVPLERAVVLQGCYLVPKESE